MVQVSPFRAIRYNPRKTHHLKRVVAPPYDCISSKDQSALYSKSPYNCVRLILRRGSFSPRAGAGLYKGVARDFEKWLSRGILKRDAAPAYYLYQQDYVVDGRHFTRTGLFGLLKLSGYGKRILPHERTLPGPKKDRLALLKAARTNFSAIFGLYSDVRRKMTGIIRPVIKKRPVMSVRGTDGVRNKVWLIDQPERVRKISRMLQGKRFWIADGHHRFETALAFHRWARSQKLKVETGYVLACLVSMEDPGCRILPIHRLVRISDPKRRQAWSTGLKRRFQMKRVDSLSYLVRMLKRPSSLHRLGFYDGKNCYFLTARKKQPGALDVEFLDRDILGPLEKRLRLRKGHEIQFEHSPKRVEQRIREGEHHFGLLMAPTRLQDMKRLTARGKRMPEKSTYFYPKILSGLMFHQFS